MNKDASVGYTAKSKGYQSRLEIGLYDYLEDFLSACEDEPHHVLLTCSQKDEIRPIEKTPRLFMAFPLEVIFAATVCLSDFCTQFYARSYLKTGSPSCVGDSPQNGAWSIYKEHLGRFPFLYCSDTSGADSSISREFLNAVYDCIKSKYVKLDKACNNVFETVRLNTIDKLCLVAGYVYHVPRGLGSGDYLTTVINILWRSYLFFDNYQYDLSSWKNDNLLLHLGDDFIMSSRYGDIDLNSPHAGIEWAGRPVTFKELDFCSLLFWPDVHHDPSKVIAVLNQRLKREHGLHPRLQLARLGGLLRCYCNKQVYDEILSRMVTLKKRYGLDQDFHYFFVSFQKVKSSYNL